MQFFILVMIILSLFVSMAPLAHPGTVNMLDEPSDSRSTGRNSSGIGTVMQGTADAALDELHFENPVTKVKETAEQAARSVGRTLGQYVKGKYMQMKNAEMVERFDANLERLMIGLPVTFAEKQQLMGEVKRAYIKDADKADSELDQRNFMDLGYVLKKEYSEFLRENTKEGIVETFDFQGRIQTRSMIRGGQLDGSVVTYYKNGEIKYIDLYEKGQKLSRKKYNSEGKLEFEQNYSYDIPVPQPEVTERDTAKAAPDNEEKAYFPDSAPSGCTETEPCDESSRPSEESASDQTKTASLPADANIEITSGI